MKGRSPEAAPDVPITTDSPTPTTAAAAGVRNALVRAFMAVAVVAMVLSSCNLLEGTGACQSDVVRMQFFGVRYCYSGWDRAECNDFDDRNVNGANWAFHPGQTCAQRGLKEGANEMP